MNLVCETFSDVPGPSRTSLSNINRYMKPRRSHRKNFIQCDFGEPSDTMKLMMVNPDLSSDAIQCPRLSFGTDQVFSEKL